jgi:putative DNA primase/helicase
MTKSPHIRDLARGKWHCILMEFGVPDAALTGKHGPCPVCREGKDRFRFDSKGGYGSWICSHCGAGDGIDLAMKVSGKPFKDVALNIEAMVGLLPAEPPSKGMSEEQVRRLLRGVSTRTVPLSKDDPVDRYLSSRGLWQPTYPSALRYVATLPDGDGEVHPAMVASVRTADDKAVSLHRTFLRPNGAGKAEIRAPRKFMPGPLPKGICVRLGAFEAGGVLGIAEGIETALSASALFGMPVWAALDAGKLEGWCPPQGCGQVMIFGDNDQRAASTIPVAARAVSSFSRKSSSKPIRASQTTSPSTGRSVTTPPSALPA